MDHLFAVYVLRALSQPPALQPVHYVKRGAILMQVALHARFVARARTLSPALPPVRNALLAVLLALVKQAVRLVQMVRIRLLTSPLVPIALVGLPHRAPYLAVALIAPGVITRFLKLLLVSNVLLVLSLPRLGLPPVSFARRGFSQQTRALAVANVDLVVTRLLVRRRALAVSQMLHPSLTTVDVSALLGML